LRDSLLILGLLLDQETDIEPVEIVTNTAAYADTVFGLFWLLARLMSVHRPAQTHGRRR
jgi:TnpA family transposase